MAAAAARADQLESIADNLANVETPGFKASYPAFQSFLPRGASPTSDKVAAAAVGTGSRRILGRTKTSSALARDGLSGIPPMPPSAIPVTNPTRNVGPGLAVPLVRKEKVKWLTAYM